jgi:hypothetical protein
MPLQRSDSDATLVHADDARQPLLPDAPISGPAKPLQGRPGARPPPTPLPRLQLAALCALRLVEPVAFTHIFPFVNELCLAVTNDPANVGFYSGMVVRAAPFGLTDAVR